MRNAWLTAAAFFCIAGTAHGQATSAGDGAAPAQGVASPAEAATPKIAEWVGQSFSVPETTVVLQTPAPDSAVASRLRAGATVDVIGILADESWLQVRMPDRSVGYVRAASIPLVSKPEMPAPPAAPAAVASAAAPPPPSPAATADASGPVAGLATIHDTSTLILHASGDDALAVGVVPVVLVGVDGFGGEPARGMEEYLETNGSWVQCTPTTDSHHVCKLRDGTDLAKAALVNGAARVTSAAPPDYVVQEQDAKQSRRGIWRDGPDSVAAIPLAAQDAPPPPGQYVVGVAYAVGEVPPFFAAAYPVEGLAFIDGQPFTLDEGYPTPLVYDEAIGWGFWDRSFKWRGAPPMWAGRLDGAHPRGDGLREVDLARHGYEFHDSYFRGPAVHASFAPGQRPMALGRSPYAAAAFAPRAALSPGGRPGLAYGGMERGGLGPHPEASGFPHPGAGALERAELRGQPGPRGMAPPGIAPRGPLARPGIEERAGAYPGREPQRAPLTQGNPAAFANRPMPQQAPSAMFVARAGVQPGAPAGFAGRPGMGAMSGGVAVARAMPAAPPMRAAPAPAPAPAPRFTGKH